MKLDPLLIPYAKMNKKSNVRSKTVKILGRKLRGKHNIGLNSDFLAMTSEAQTTKR